MNKAMKVLIKIKISNIKYIISKKIYYINLIAKFATSTKRNILY